MYKISFDPRTGKFVLQVLQYSLFWVVVRNNGKPVYYSTYNEVAEHVHNIGLSTLYADKSENKFRGYMALPQM